MDSKIFNTENFDNLKRICKNIVSLSDENIDGQLMASQLVMLGEAINQFSNNPIVKTSGCLTDEPLTKIVVNTDAKTARIEDEYQRVKSAVIELASKGYDNFTMVVRGDYGEAYQVCDKLKELGVFICERGYDHRGFGESAYANVNFYIPKK